MKRLLSLLFILIIGLTQVWAQEEPIPPRRGSSPVKMGLFGGFTPGYVSLNMDPFNTFLKGSGIPEFDQKGAFLWGGAGAAYIMLVPNLRVGGMGVSGSISTSGSVQVPSVGSAQRSAQLKVGFGGVTIEYVFPFGEKLDVAVGAILGAGGVDLILRQDKGGVTTWSGEQGSFASTVWPPSGMNSVSRTLSGSFFVWIPTVHIEYAVVGWMALRVGVSYVGMSFPSWSLDSVYDLNNVPSEVSGSGVMFTAGILLGTF